MIADAIFSSFVPHDVAATLRSVGEEFSEAERHDGVSARLGRKYLKALKAYENALRDCPYSPGAMIIEPSAHTSMMREKMNKELTRIEEERARIRAHFGGALALTADEDEE